MSFIKKIAIKNYVGIEEKSFDAGKINRLTGHKGSGKTSIIEAIEKAFTNKDRRTEVIRHGEDEAVIFLQLDDGLEINRKIRNNKTDYLKVSKPGEAVPSTETYLRRFISGDIFRPIEFVSKSPEEQAKILLDMLKIEWTKEDIVNWFGELTTEINYEQHILKILKQIENKYYAEREAINREINVLNIQVRAIKDQLPGNYDAELWRTKSISEYYAKVAQAEEVNKKIAAARGVIEGLELKISNIKNSAEIKKQRYKEYFKNRREEVNNRINFLASQINAEQKFLNASSERIQRKEDEIDKELMLEIERITAAFEKKKVDEVQKLKDEDGRVIMSISRYNSEISEKGIELENIDTAEALKLENVEDVKTFEIETEKAKSGNAEEVLENNTEIDVEPLRMEADKVVEMQSYLRDYDRMIDIIREKLSPRQQRSADLTAKIEKARNLPMELLKTANVPVKGMEVDAEGRIRVNGVLIDGLSEGEQLEFAFNVAKARAGDFKFICIDGINKINPADRKNIEGEMETDDYQYFVIETTDGELTIEIIK